MWLRDRCDCADCRRSTTNERLLDQAALKCNAVRSDIAAAHNSQGTLEL